MHATAHPKAGQTAQVLPHVLNDTITKCEFCVEDWWDRVAGKSWMQSDGNPACLQYAMRTGMADHNVPTDDEVLYGNIGSFGHLLHVSELDLT